MNLKTIISIIFLLVFLTSAAVMVLTRPPQQVKEVATVEEDVKVYFREGLESRIYQQYNEAIKFSSFNYKQWDPMDIGLYHCSNTFKNEVTKKEHSYLARVGYYPDTQDSIVYFIQIDGETVYWDEEGEDAFIESKGE